MSTEKIRQALNIAFAAAQGQIKPERNDEWMEIVNAADRELMALAHRLRQDAAR